ncbi:TolB-like translocation protein [Streptomyces sp. AM 2-1-1]|uniref:TolB-like translocation protein n=1 Tax=Streptomyces sp. AM 2-1-1 TaxID=3028709 RepID=UPI0023B8D0EF|nr:TolB-like translocation protein [Streptomyces sp. AM 2-1-1]WEH43117.1 TolB-like translocation protein [Streptomyces sp. AM 2-1-1]
MTRLRTRLLVLLCASAVLAVVATASVLHAADRSGARDVAKPGGPAVTAGRVTLTDEHRIVFRNMAWGPHRDEVTTVDAGAPGGARTTSGVKCLRFYAASGTAVCLQAVHGTLTDTYRATILDRRLKERAHYALPGIPSRARVSPSGRLAAWTVFVGGDSYAGTNFSTRAAILDTRTGDLVPTLEDFAILKDGRPYRAADVNFWGVTFDADDRHFYATLATQGHTYLVRGDLRTRTVTTLRTNVECPSLSPDGSRIAYKRRDEGLPSDAPWRLHVLDLRTLADHPLAEGRSVDDQAVWKDDTTVTYALPGDFGADLYEAAADGSGHPRRVMTAAVSPAYP